MRKIEQQMIKAVKAKDTVTLSNTSVVYDRLKDWTDIYLFGNHIATYYHGDKNWLAVDTATLRQWNTKTTKSRLRALGAKVKTVKGVIFLNGVEV